MSRKPNGNAVLGYLLTDPKAYYWWSGELWVRLTEFDDAGHEYMPFLPPAEAFIDDAKTAKKKAETLQAQGVDVRPTRVAYLC